jgi:hypothetical protein
MSGKRVISDQISGIGRQEKSSSFADSEGEKRRDGRQEKSRSFDCAARRAIIWRTGKNRAAPLRMTTRGRGEEEEGFLAARTPLEMTGTKGLLRG